MESSSKHVFFEESRRVVGVGKNTCESVPE